MMGLYFTDGRLPFPVNHGTSSDDLLLKVKLLTCCFPGSMTSKRMGDTVSVYSGCTYLLCRLVTKQYYTTKLDIC